MNHWDTKPSAWLALTPALVLAAVVGVVVAQRGLGFILLFVVPITTLWAGWSLFATRGWPERRRLAWKKIGAWALVLAGVGVVHWRYSVGAREVGDAIARAVTRFQAATGRYPDSLADAGIDPAFARRGRAVYVMDAKGAPTLAYVSTFEMMSTYSYDFQARRWTFTPD